MKKLIIFLNVFFLLSGIAIAESRPFDIVAKELDKNIFWLITTHPDRKSVVEKFGAPHLDEKNTIYYALNDYKYSLSIKFSKDHVSYVNYRLPPENKVVVKDFIDILKSSDFSLYPPSGHEKGRYLSVALKKENLELIFENNSTKKLSRIVYGQK